MIAMAIDKGVNYGIYVLEIGMGVYVGQSIDIERRLAEHERDITKQGFKELARLKVPELVGKEGKDLLRIAEQTVMDMLRESGRGLTNGRREVATTHTLYNEVERFKKFCRGGI